MFVHVYLNYFGATCIVGDFDGLFTVEIHHKGFFYGAGSNRTYMDYEIIGLTVVIVNMVYIVD